MLLSCAAFGLCGNGGNSFCEGLPVRDDANSAVFVALVKEVGMPGRAVPPATEPSGAAPQGRLRAGDPRPNEQVRYPVARLRVLERFAGAEPDEVELRLSSDLFVDGVPQGVPPLAPGETWLVEAYRDARDRQWTTNHCLRTKPLANAGEDLRVLRAWANGQTLPARVDGEVYNSEERRGVAGVTVYLRGERQVFSALTDPAGHFAFAKLQAGIYELSAALPQVSTPVRVDLTRAWCAHRVLTAR